MMSPRMNGFFLFRPSELLINNGTAHCLRRKKTRWISIAVLAVDIHFCCFEQTCEPSGGRNGLASSIIESFILRGELPVYAFGSMN